MALAGETVKTANLLYLLRHNPFQSNLERGDEKLVNEDSTLEKISESLSQAQLTTII